MKVLILEHPDTGIIKKAYLGFEIGVLIFGPFYPLFRGDIKWVFIMSIVVVLTAGAGLLLFPFMYNKLYLKDLLKKGYKISDLPAEDLAEVSKRLGIKLKAINS